MFQTFRRYMLPSNSGQNFVDWSTQFSTVPTGLDEALPLSPSPPVAPTLERTASVKRFVSLQLLNPRTVGKTPWTGDEPVSRPLPTQTQNKRTQTSMPLVGFEPTITVLERAKTVRAQDGWPLSSAAMSLYHSFTRTSISSFAVSFPNKSQT
jgi:hypothetical protein